MRPGELVPIDTITVGERRRQDLGDLTGLMESLKTTGLIHPIVVTDDLTLVAGARRLEATKRLGATVIEVRRVGDLTDQERSIIELEENLHRKNLTPIERSRATVTLGVAVGVHLREQAQTQEAQGVEPNHDQVVSTETSASPRPDEYCSPADQKSTRVRGAPEKPDSQRKVAAEMGVSQATLIAAQQHAEAVQCYPELGAPDISQREAIRLWKMWEDMRPSNRSRSRNLWNAQRQAAMDQAEDSTETPKAPKPKAAKSSRAKAHKPPDVSAQVQVTRTWYALTAGVLQVINDFERNGGTSPLLACWTPEELARAQEQIQERITQLQRIARELAAEIPQSLPA